MKKILLIFISFFLVACLNSTDNSSVNSNLNTQNYENICEDNFFISDDNVYYNSSYERINGYYKVEFDNISMEFYANDGIAYGSKKWYNSEGKLYAETKILDDGSDEILSAYFDESGSKVDSIANKNIIYYKNKPFDGIYTTYYEDGKTIRSVFTYINGKIEGKSYSYYRNGLIHSESESDYINNELAYEVYFYPNVNISFEYYKNGDKGYQKSYNQEGVVDWEAFIDGDREHQKSYNTEGITWEAFIDGDKDHCIYYNNSVIEMEILIEKNSKIVKIYESGIIETEITYLNDENHGPYKNYNENGSLISEFEYKNNIMDGPYYIYLEDGNKIAEGEAHNDKIESLYCIGENGERHELSVKHFSHDYKNLSGRCLSLR